MHHAGTALAGVAADMGAGQIELLAQELRDKRRRLDISSRWPSVECEGYLHDHTPVRDGYLGKWKRAAGGPCGHYDIADGEGIREERLFGHVGDERVVGHGVEHDLDEIALVFDRKHAARQRGGAAGR